MMLEPLLTSLQRITAAWLSQPDPGHVCPRAADPRALERLLEPGDVLLVDGDTRFARIVKTMTRSTWSHVAIYVGPINDEPDAPNVVEADVKDGVRALSLAQFRACHVRVMRAVGLRAVERRAVADGVIARLGQGYDLRHAIRLGRAQLPMRQRPIEFAVDPERAICSTLIAQAFAAVGHPVFPDAKRHWGACTPRDFDVSPHFEAIEPEAPRPAPRRTKWLAPMVGGALVAAAAHAGAAARLGETISGSGSDFNADAVSAPADVPAAQASPPI